MEKTEENSRLTVERLKSSEEQAEFRTFLFTLSSMSVMERIG